MTGTDARHRLFCAATLDAAAIDAVERAVSGAMETSAIAVLIRSEGGPSVIDHKHRALNLILVDARQVEAD